MAEFFEMDVDEICRLEKIQLDALERGGPAVDNELLKRFVLGADHHLGDLQERNRKEIWSLVRRYRSWHIAHSIHVSTFNTMGSD